MLSCACNIRRHKCTSMQFLPFLLYRCLIVLFPVCSWAEGLHGCAVIRRSMTSHAGLHASFYATKFSSLNAPQRSSHAPWHFMGIGFTAGHTLSLCTTSPAVSEALPLRLLGSLLDTSWNHSELPFTPCSLGWLSRQHYACQIGASSRVCQTQHCCWYLMTCPVPSRKFIHVPGISLFFR